MKLNLFVIFQENPDGTGILFNPESNQPVKLNRTGAFICRQLTGNAGIGQVAAAFAAEFSISPERARADVENFIGALDRKGFLETPLDPR
jgi:hypothetical protein